MKNSIFLIVFQDTENEEVFFKRYFFVDKPGFPEDFKEALEWAILKSDKKNWFINKIEWLGCIENINES